MQMGLLDLDPVYMQVFMKDMTFGPSTYANRTFGPDNMQRGLSDLVLFDPMTYLVFLMNKMNVENVFASSICNSSCANTFLRRFSFLRDGSMCFYHMPVRHPVSYSGQCRKVEPNQHPLCDIWKDCTVHILSTMCTHMPTHTERERGGWGRGRGEG